MSVALKVQVQGLDKVKQMFKDIGQELNDFQVRNILIKQGQVVVKAARQSTQFPGRIGQQFKKDLGVRRNRFAKGKPHVDVGIMFNKHLNDQATGSHSQNKIGVIAAHFTEGFNQHLRTSRGKSRGVVAQQYQNPVTTGFRKSKSQMEAATNKEIKKQLEKVKRKHSNILI